MPELFGRKTSEGLTPGPVIDTSKASSARMYDYFLGGKDNYEVDREFAEQVIKVVPYARVAARHNRDFMHRAAAHLVGMGCRQFLDIGTGIPSEPNLHQVAQDLAPEARVVYVDNDPLVLAHARALMVGSPEGTTAYLDADLTDPDSILTATRLRDTLDLDAPVAVSVVAVLHFIPANGQARDVVSALLDAMPSGSFLVISHATADFDPDVGEALRRYNQSGVTARSRTGDEVLALFEGLSLIEPGLVQPHKWHAPMRMPKYLDKQIAFWAGVARKP
jgi:hypothetical protein